MKLTPAKIDWQDLPKAVDFGDVFFAKGSFAEVNAVFIEPNNLRDRFANSLRFSIGETGFASGLSFLSAAKVWLASSSAELDNAQLHFYSVEKFPWLKSDLNRWYAEHPLKNLAQELIDKYPPLIAGWHKVYMFNNRVVLHLYFGEALAGFANLDNQLDAWFLDGFAPDKNPEMWDLNLFKQLRRLSKVGTSVATFTAAGFVRRNLSAAGFTIEKIKGFAGKREMVRGWVEQERNFSSKSPWYEHPKPIKLTEELAGVGVVGAGLAGAAAAYVLACKGFKVKVFEEQLKPALGASGNISGLFYPVFTADWGRRSQWYWQGLQTSLRYLKPLIESGKVAGSLAGCLIIPPTEAQKKRLEKSLEFLPEEIIEKVTADKACELAGVQRNLAASDFDAFLSKFSGWVSPSELVLECLSHPNIELSTGEKPKINQLEEGWELVSQNKKWRVGNLILATGAWEAALAEADLDLRRLKGQVTHLDKSAEINLAMAVSHKGYSAPARTGWVSGASFEADYTEKDLSSAGNLSRQVQQENLELLGEVFPKLLQEQAYALAGRVAVRAMSSDHLPWVGPLASDKSLQENYLSKQNNLAGYQYSQQEYIQGLYVTNGHGARGLTSVFLAAEIIAGDLLNHPYLEDKNLYQASHPARFAIRSWKARS